MNIGNKQLQLQLFLDSLIITAADPKLIHKIRRYAEENLNVYGICVGQTHSIKPGLHDKHAVISTMQWQGPIDVSTTERICEGSTFFHVIYV